MTSLPGWLTKRARDVKATNIVTLLAPASERSAAMYLLEIGGTFELHVVEDAQSGIDGVTIPLSRREAFKLTQQLVAALSGRIPPLAVPVVDEAPETVAP